jgi:hypothetical protein
MKIIKTFVAAAIFAATASAIAAPAVCSVDLKPGVTDVTVRSYQVIDVCLPAGQKIAEFASGYPDGWMVTGNKETGRLMVKLNGAAGGAIETNIIVWSDTNERYEIKLSQSFASEIKTAKK